MSNPLRMHKGMFREKPSIFLPTGFSVWMMALFSELTDRSGIQNNDMKLLDDLEHFGTVLVSYFSCNKYYKFNGLKQHKFFIL